MPGLKKQKWSFIPGGTHPADPKSGHVAAVYTLANTIPYYFLYYLLYYYLTVYVEQTSFLLSFTMLTSYEPTKKV